MGTRTPIPAPGAPPAATGAPFAPAASPRSSAPYEMNDRLFLTTRAGYLVAVDAHSRQTVGSVQHGPGSCRVDGGRLPCYTASSPAVDPNRRFVYSYRCHGRPGTNFILIAVHPYSAIWCL